MRKLRWVIAIAIVCVGGCATLRGIVLPGNSELDKSRRFLDQTSDNPYR